MHFPQRLSNRILLVSRTYRLCLSIAGLAAFPFYCEEIYFIGIIWAVDTLLSTLFLGFAIYLAATTSYSEQSYAPRLRQGRQKLSIQPRQSAEAALLEAQSSGEEHGPVAEAFRLQSASVVEISGTKSPNPNRSTGTTIDTGESSSTDYETLDMTVSYFHLSRYKSTTNNLPTLDKQFRRSRAEH